MRKTAKLYFLGIQKLIWGNGCKEWRQIAQKRQLVSRTTFETSRHEGESGKRMPINRCPILTTHNFVCLEVLMSRGFRIALRKRYFDFSHIVKPRINMRLKSLQSSRGTIIATRERERETERREEKIEREENNASRCIRMLNRSR